jgi:mobilome CxxCx(11)CxxC protein
MSQTQSTQDVKTLKRRAYQTYYIMERKANRLRSRIAVVNYLGLVIPIVTAGLIVLIYDKSWFSAWAIQGLTFVGGLLALVQLTIALWALVSKWDDKLARSQETMIRFSRLEHFDPNDERQLRKVNDACGSEARMADFLVGVSPKEKARGREEAMIRYP